MQNEFDSPDESEWDEEEPYYDWDDPDWREDWDDARCPKSAATSAAAPAGVKRPGGAALVAAHC